MASFYRARQVWEQHKAHLLALPGVVGGGVGGRTAEDGKRVVGEACIRLYLCDRCGATTVYPSHVDGVAIEAEITGEVHAAVLDWGAVR